MTGIEQLPSNLPAILAEQLPGRLKACPEVQQAVLYGSRAKGTHRPNSDIDICLDAPDMAFSDFLQLSAQLDELALPYSLDLALKHHIENPDLLDHINRVGVVIYQKR